MGVAEFVVPTQTTQNIDSLFISFNFNLFIFVLIEMQMPNVYFYLD